MERGETKRAVLPLPCAPLVALSVMEGDTEASALLIDFVFQS
jgi:hypothetical protein